MPPKPKDLKITSLREAVESAEWKLANYKKTFGKFPGSYDSIMTVLKLAANDDESESDFEESESDLEDTLLGWISDDIMVTKSGLQFDLDAGAHIRRFKYSAKTKKWTSEKVSFDGDLDEKFGEDEYDGII